MHAHGITRQLIVMPLRLMDYLSELKFQCLITLGNNWFCASSRSTQGNDHSNAMTRKTNVVESEAVEAVFEPSRVHI